MSVVLLNILATLAHSAARMRSRRGGDGDVDADGDDDTDIEAQVQPTPRDEGAAAVARRRRRRENADDTDDSDDDEDGPDVELDPERDVIVVDDGDTANATAVPSTPFPNRRDSMEIRPTRPPLPNRTPTDTSLATQADDEKTSRRGIRVGRTFTTFSTWSTASSTLAPKKPPGKVKQWLTKCRDFVFQSGDGYKEVEFVPNYRWTPIFSGVTIPFAILLEIPGLNGHWYVKTLANKVVEVQSNPPLVEVGMGFSMACAIIANIALIRRFLEVQPRIMTFIAMSALAIHDVINIVCCVIFAVERRFDDGFTYGQPFWMTVGSTAVSVFTIVTLGYDYLTTADFETHGSGLTRKQRSLVIIVMILLCWVALGAIVYSQLMHLPFIDGLYFTVVSIETIGYGDFHPDNTASRVFSIFYNTIGILNLGMAISTCRETIIESFQHSYRKSLEKMIERRNEKREKKFRRTAVERALRQAGLPVYVTEIVGGPEGEEEASTRARGRGGGGYRKPSKIVLNEKALTSEMWTNVKEEVHELLSRHRKHGSDNPFCEIKKGEEKTVDDMRDDLHKLNGTQRMIELLGGDSSSYFEKEQRREFIVKLTTAWALFLTFWLIGGVIFMNTEKWSYGSALYFCFVTFSTIGYGDLAPESPAGRSIFVVWAMLGVATMTILFSVLAEAYSSKYNALMFSHRFRKSVEKYRRRETMVYQEEVPPPPPLPPATVGDEKGEEVGTIELPSSEGLGGITSPPLGDDGDTRGHSVESSSSSSSPDGNGATQEEVLSLILKDALKLQSHALFLLGSESTHPPESLMELLIDITEMKFRGRGETHRHELLEDAENRKLLLMVSIEKTMKSILGSIESAGDSTSSSTKILPGMVESPAEMTGIATRRTLSFPNPSSSSD